MGLFYRSASLYHPQRRAILHLKNQRRKVKDKNRHSNRTPFFDFKTLRSKTIRITLVATACNALGLYLPIVHLAHQLQIDGLDDRVLVLQTNMGLAWMVGACVFGFLVIRNHVECRIARQLCQSSLLMCAICMLALAQLQPNFDSYLIIVWVYGEFCWKPEKERERVLIGVNSFRRFLLRRLPLCHPRVHLWTRSRSQLRADLEFRTICSRLARCVRHSSRSVFQSICGWKVWISLRFRCCTQWQPVIVPDRYAQTKCIAPQTFTVNSALFTRAFDTSNTIFTKLTDRVARDICACWKIVPKIEDFHSRKKVITSMWIISEWPQCSCIRKHCPIIRRAMRSKHYPLAMETLHTLDQTKRHSSSTISPNWRAFPKRELLTSKPWPETIPIAWTSR